MNVRNLTKRETLLESSNAKESVGALPVHLSKKKNQDGAALGPLFYGTNPLLFNISKLFHCTCCIYFHFRNVPFRITFLKNGCYKLNSFQKWYFVQKIISSYCEKKLPFFSNLQKFFSHPNSERLEKIVKQNTF